MAAVSEPLKIEIKSKGFPPVGDRPALPVLKDVDVTIKSGSFVVITGPSGCGKSTLLNIVAGLDHEYTGRIDFGATDPTISFMFQTPRLLPWRTVEENIALILPKEDPRIAQIPELLRRVGLEGTGSAYPERLSLGMQRRAALARAFILEPDILLMDEPFVSLDDPTAHALRQLLLELWSKRPTTVLFVTHDRTESVMLATRLIRVGGSPARVVQDVNISLSTDQRADPSVVQAERDRLFQEA